ncbi:MAG: SufD family Fe-S cluster assembly protein [Candidatus Njordarchaeota archaeon]
MPWRDKYKEKAKKAINKPARHGIDIDILEFNPRMAGEEIDLSASRDLLEAVGIDVEEKNRAGSFYQLESQVISAIAKQPGIEILSMEEAIEKYGKDMEEYFWKAVNVDADKYTAIAELMGKGGYFIRVKKGHKIEFPVQACLLMEQNQSLQAPHNIIIAEEGSEISIVTGCATMKESIGLHAGITEIYINEKARVNYIMIHKWSKAMHIRPRTGVIVRNGGMYVSHYIAFTDLKSFQSMPKVILHENAKAYLSSMVVLEGEAIADSGYYLRLMGNNASGQIVSRSITKDTSEIITRAYISGESSSTVGHIDCQGLLLSEKSRILTIPILDAIYDNVMLTHEAAVGKLSEEKILWLMARGFSREEAESILVKGFMRTDLPDLPKPLESMINQTLEIIAKSVL